MKRTPLRVVVNKTCALRWPSVLLAVLVIILALPTRSWANSISSIPCSSALCTISEAPVELLVKAIPGLSLGASAKGVVVIYDDVAHTLVSDVVAFANVLGVATVTFVSDAEGPLTLPPDVPILGKFTEGSPISISLALAGGKFLTAKICSDVTETAGCSGTSDSIGLAETTTPVPEPGTLFLVGSGVFGSGFWGLRKAHARRLGGHSKA